MTTTRQSRIRRIRCRERSAAQRAKAAARLFLGHAQTCAGEPHILFPSARQRVVTGEALFLRGQVNVCIAHSRVGDYWRLSSSRAIARITRAISPRGLATAALMVAISGSTRRIKSCSAYNVS